MEKVITAHEMTRIEQMAYANGASPGLFMENAGKSIAEVLSFLNLADQVFLLVGKGNNGGDAYAAGCELLNSGFSVEAWHVYPLEECSALCQEQHDRFTEGGGIVHYDEVPFPEEGIILDGLVGTGFEGAAEGVLAQAISFANNAQLPIVAIDIPSGLNGTTGEVATVAIHALMTIYLGLPKLGFFIGSGWNHVGELVHADFGMDPEYLAAAHPVAHLLHDGNLELPTIRRSRHKYEAGYVLGVAGSPGMAGSASLSSLATLRAGAGIVRLFHPEGLEKELVAAPYEIIKEPFHIDRFLVEAKRAKALFVGPGMGRTDDKKQLLQILLATITLPTVVDGDALFLLSENPHWRLPDACILTPHHKEMERLLSKVPTLPLCQEFVEQKKVTLVLKGGPTVIFHPGELPLIVTHGDPGMATAGSGDVLTGILAGLLAQGCNTYDAATLGTMLHGLAGEQAAIDKTSYCLIASDILDYLHKAYQQFLFQ